jgi:hypothetical protein
MRYVTGDTQSTFSRVTWAFIVILSFFFAGKSINDSFSGKLNSYEIVCFCGVLLVIFMLLWATG